MSSQITQTLIERPPIVVIMGHVDHGKSTLLDYIRKSNIVAGESGGITQHVAAYEIIHKTEDGEKCITFIDTPGHEAFSDIRTRGASIADIAILIVSAEDGVKQQTVEAFKAIRESGMPLIVGINKIDSPKADINKTQTSLIENEIYIEGLGGDIPFVEISAKTGVNIPELLDLVLLASELEEFKADPNADAEGFIIEANKDTQKGIIATVIIKNGTLKIGTTIACDNAFSPIRSLENGDGKQVKEATFSAPVRIAGWNESPDLGSSIKVFSNKKDAEKYVQDKLIIKNKDINKGGESLDVARDKQAEIGGEKEKAEDIKEITESNTALLRIPIVIKSDVAGSLDAIELQIKKVEVENVEFLIINKSTGNITEADIKQASAREGSIVIGFNVGLGNQAEMLRERDSVTVKTFSIIYDITDYLQTIAEERKPRVETQEILGSAKILRTFSRTKNLQILGGKIKEGTLAVGNKVQIMRRNEEIGKGIIKNLQQQKSEVKEIKDEGEFGAAIETKTELAENDHINAFSIVIK